MKQSFTVHFTGFLLLCSMLSLGPAEAFDFQPEIESITSAASCNQDQKNQLTLMTRLIERKLATLTDATQGIQKYDLDYVQKNVIPSLGLTPSPKFKRHDSTYESFHRRVMATLLKMKAKSIQGINYTCSSSWSSYCSGDTNAYTLDNHGQIYNQVYLCPRFFDQAAKAQARTVFHELSHLVDINVDHFLGSVFNDMGLIDSAYDAYFYEKFMDEELTWVLERNAWRIIWVKS